MKGLIVYKGKYGATAQYASWISEALDLPKLDLNTQVVDSLAGYDFIIAGSPVYAGRLLIKEWLHLNQQVLQTKKIFLFVICASAYEDTTQQLNIIKNNIPYNLIQVMETFFLPGRVIINKLSWLDRVIVKLGAILEKDPAKKQLMRRGFDAVNRTKVNTLIHIALNFSNSEVLP